MVFPFKTPTVAWQTLNFAEYFIKLSDTEAPGKYKELRDELTEENGESFEESDIRRRCKHLRQNIKVDGRIL
jgi:hypothetical protein